MNKGKLIVIEGACDGIGKSTQYNMLINALLSEGYEVYKHHFPSYGTDEGLLAQKYLKGDFGKPSDLSPYFVNSLYAIDRKITWENSLKDKYNNGKIILLDRYTTSSIIYQSALIDDVIEKNKFIDYVIDYEYNKLGIGIPDQVIFLTASFDAVTNLRLNREYNDGIVNDIHESDYEFMKKVYDNALYVAKYLNWDIITCDINDIMLSKEEIHSKVYKMVRK